MKKKLYKITFTIETSMSVLGVDEAEATKTWLRDMTEANELFKGKLIKIEDTGARINV